MSHRVFLHAGLPKSGTTFLQGVLVDNKARLADAGLLFPGPGGWRDQVLAVRDIRQMPHRSPEMKAEVTGAWDRLAQEILAWPGDAVVSMEWLSRVKPDHLRRLTESLESREIHLVLTVRDLARVVPASWQESVLNKRDATWPEFLREISDEAVPRSERRLWRLHDVVPLIERWTGSIPTEHVHVITVPRPGAAPDTLWQRFAEVVGVTEVPVELSSAPRNHGLGLTASELMRRVNVRAREQDLDHDVRLNVLVLELAKQGLVQRPDEHGRPTIPDEWHAWVEDETDRRITGLEELRARGLQIVGDLEELRPDLSGHVGETREPTTEELLDAALDAMVMMARQRADREEALEASLAEAEAGTRRSDAPTSLLRRLSRRRTARDHD